MRGGRGRGWRGGERGSKEGWGGGVVKCRERGWEGVGEGKETRGDGGRWKGGGEGREMMGDGGDITLITDKETVAPSKPACLRAYRLSFPFLSPLLTLANPPLLTLQL